MSHSSQRNEPVPDPITRLPAPLRRLVLEKEILRLYRSGEQIMGASNWGEQIRFIVSGEASLVLLDDENEKISVDTLGPGDIFGEVNFFTGSPWPSDSQLIADNDCQVVEIAPEDFEKLLRQNPDFTLPLVRNLVRKIIHLHRTVLESRVKRRALQSMISREDHVFPGHLVGDYVRRRFASRVEELAQSDGPVLIMGEMGVGKEGISHAIFRAGHQCKEVFLQFDLLRTGNESQFEVSPSEDHPGDLDATDEQLRLFFGSEEPGRDGGIKETAGYFQLAQEGTLMVRGVDRLTRVMQLKLLEALATQTFRRCGGVRLHKARIRLIATTRLDPSQASLERHPLIYALLLERSIIIPPLRTRRREIPDLVKRYAELYSRELGRKVERLPKDTLKALVNYAWPGNDLELASTLKRAIIVSQGGVLRPEDIYFDLKRIEEKGKINLLKFRRVKQVLTSPHFPAVLQSAATPFFFIVLAFLFLGPTDPMKNPAALFSWAVGWPILIIGAFFYARFWCSVCPIGTLGKLAKKIIALERPFPPFLKNHSDFLIAGAVLFIIWLETATGIRNSPFNLGLLLLAMLISAIVVAVIYERQSWCLYLCGLGGMVGLLAKTSIVELRADRNVCISQCGTNDCYLGGSNSEGCPFGQAGPRLHSNRVCKLCGICVKNCPHGAINLNLRFPGREIWEIRQPKIGTAFLVLGMIGGLLSEMVSKTQTYDFLTGFLPVPQIASFTLVFLAILLAVNLLMMLAAFISCHVYGDTLSDNYARFGLSLLPVALTAFTAFHVYYLINLGVELPTLLSHNLDFAVFSELIITVPPWVTQLLQQILLWTGLAWTLMIIYRIGSESHDKMFNVLVGLLPHAALASILTLVIQEAMHSFFYG